MEEVIIGIILLIIQVLMGIIVMNSNSTIKELKEKDTEMSRELTDVKINYVHKQDLKDLKQEISDRFVDLKQWIKEELKGQ